MFGDTGGGRGQPGCLGATRGDKRVAWAGGGMGVRLSPFLFLSLFPSVPSICLSVPLSPSVRGTQSPSICLSSVIHVRLSPSICPSLCPSGSPPPLAPLSPSACAPLSNRPSPVPLSVPVPLSPRGHHQCAVPAAGRAGGRGGGPRGGSAPAAGTLRPPHSGPWRRRSASAAAAERPLVCLSLEPSVRKAVPESVRVRESIHESIPTPSVRGSVRLPINWCHSPPNTRSGFLL